MDEERYDLTVFSGVYPPSEDTYLLLDAIEIKPDDMFLEVGCGAGLITLAAAKRARIVIGIDRSFEAVRNTLENLRRNGLYKNYHVIEADLLGAIAPSVRFSLIVFNPPYLPQDDENTDLDHALVGGQAGTELTQRFVRQAIRHLTSAGRMFVVVSSLADIDSIRKTMNECELFVDMVSEKPLFFEKIQVLRGVH
ncbi:MAG: HemK2/MTQ2 family protein methyltransferase [Promethearchaeota archaeon]